MRSAAEILVLFDVDATLISTGGVGFRAMVAAGRELFGPAFSGEGVSFAGRLDPVILRELLASNGVRSTAREAHLLRAGYTLHLERLLAGVSASGDLPMPHRMLPGVAELIGALEGRCTLGLLTGNFESSGRMKLRACGLDPDRFGVRVWGDDSPHEPPARDHLPPVAVDRHARLMGVRPSRVTIVGDTPLDVGCARAHGHRSLGVATGQFGVEALAAAGATRAVDDLRDTLDLSRWLIEDERPGRASAESPRPDRSAR